MGGNFLLKLNIGSRPIANKYREGKMKRTLERELKVPENAEKEANETSFQARDCCWLWPVMFLESGCQRKLSARGLCPLVVFSSGSRSFGVRPLPRFRNAGAFHCGIIVVKVLWTLEC